MSTKGDEEAPSWKDVCQDGDNNNHDEVPISEDGKDNIFSFAKPASDAGTDAAKVAAIGTDTGNRNVVPAEVDEEALSWKDVYQDSCKGNRNEIPINEDYKDNAPGSRRSSILNQTKILEEELGIGGATAPIETVIPDIDVWYDTVHDTVPNKGVTNTASVHIPNASTNGTGNAPTKSATIAPVFRPPNPTGNPTGNTPSPANQAATNTTASSTENANTLGLVNNMDHTTMKPTIDQKYPQDSYSFLALNGPKKNELWTKEKIFFFLFGLVPFIFQILFLVLLLWSETDGLRGTMGENDNPDAGNEKLLDTLALFVPANASLIIRYTQVTAIAAFVIFPDSSLRDIVTAVRVFPRPSTVQSGDSVGSLKFSCLLRALQGSLAVVVTLLLVITSDAVVDIILNFTAVNFISHLDDSAFDLAMSGDFGPALQAEAERIANKDLPKDKTPKHVYNMIVSGLISLILFGTMIFVIIAQNSNKLWVTKTLRVQFQEETGLNEYSGCFEINTNKNSIFYSRRSYNSLYPGIISNSSTSFGYCRSNRQWIVFEGNEDGFDPCRTNTKLAHSMETDSYDISTSFDESWVSTSNTPLDLYFFESNEKEELFCDLYLGDGICNTEFNKLGYDFDGGDCCAATCIGSNCGRGGNSSAFGKMRNLDVYYPDCTNPKMLPFTIKLNHVTSSRVFFEGELTYVDENENEWKSDTPEEPYFALRCDDKTVLTGYINDTMVGNHETVMINDGANCSLVVRNSTTNSAPMPEYDDPIWIVNYTIFQEANNGEMIEIQTQQSNQESTINFKTIPQCYFEQLAPYVNVTSIYTTSSPTNKAVLWLDGEDSDCNDAFFVERFALSAIHFALKISDVLMNKQDQCQWRTIFCSEGRVETLSLVNLTLEDRYVPSEIFLLQSLGELKLSFNSISSISEFIKMVRLRRLHLAHNKISSIPAEIGRMTNLEHLDLTHNEISSIPAGIGQMTSLEDLLLSHNKISSIQAEIGQMTGLEKLGLNSNKISEIPTEIGQMTNLRKLSLDDNRIISIPTQIGLLTNLQYLDFSDNSIRSIPSEIGKLTNLKELSMRRNNFAEIEIPPEVSILCSSTTFLCYFDGW